jgi:UDPglucose 6-dehydrogenase
MNEYQKERFVTRILDNMFNTVSGKSIAILGYAFKKDTNDLRESPAIAVCRRLLEEKADLRIYDPKVKPESILSSLGLNEEDSGRITFCEDAEDACRGTHAIALLTEWDEFKEMDFAKIFEQMTKPAYFFDGRNLLDLAELKQIGFRAFAIGKS